MLGSYLLGIFPPGRRFAFADMANAADHLLAAHVRAYDVVKRLQPEATVTTNNVSISLYELDRVLIDVLAARRYGMARDRHHGVDGGAPGGVVRASRARRAARARPATGHAGRGGAR